MSEDNVKPLPVKFKAPPSDDLMLKIVHTGGCSHDFGAQYLIRKGETEVECSKCSTRLDPMFVLLILARKESHWNETRKKYQDEMKRLNERTRTKCDNCGHMTRISRR